MKQSINILQSPFNPGYPNGNVNPKIFPPNGYEQFPLKTVGTDFTETRELN